MMNDPSVEEEQGETTRTTPATRHLAFIQTITNRSVASLLFYLMTDLI